MPGENINLELRLKNIDKTRNYVIEETKPNWFSMKEAHKCPCGSKLNWRLT